ncbi:MAG: ribosome-associated translation inhibitor RaiA [Brooklawnia sp.]|uniref:ribosome hibernation-promoting factor, HPF/YfiA family n=1 Tax=Brooklawnia sp. TaxID=2699740 RepID=UPI003C746602
MDVSITGRRLTVNDTTREQVADRLNSTISRLRERVIRTEVEFTAADSKGDPDGDVRCEITLRGKGPVIRAIGHGPEKMLAFDRAEDKLKSQLRRAADRRKQHRGLRGSRELAEAGVGDAALVFGADQQAPVDEVPRHEVAGLEVHGDGPLVVREKRFKAAPLTLAQALDEMELVGHDFFLYVDAETREPSVVYRRKAYDYGVIHLAVDDEA